MGVGVDVGVGLGAGAGVGVGLGAGTAAGIGVGAGVSGEAGVGVAACLQPVRTAIRKTTATIARVLFFTLLHQSTWLSFRRLLLHRLKSAAPVPWTNYITSLITLFGVIGVVMGVIYQFNWYQH